jgi:hypothetical protein
MNPEKPATPKPEDEEEVFAGQLQQGETWKEERISEEQRVGWFEAEHLLEERLRQVDPRIKASFMEMRAPKTRTLSDPFAEKMVPEISVTFGSYEVAVIKGMGQNRQEIDLKALRKKLEEIADEVSRKVEKLLRKSERPQK